MYKRQVIERYVAGEEIRIWYSYNPDAVSYTHLDVYKRQVCTHPDGHNHSGNIHVHIVIYSLRIEEVPFLPYMDRPADTKAGCKHRCTDAALRYFKSEVMEMCHREGLDVYKRQDLITCCPAQFFCAGHFVERRESMQTSNKMA